MKYNNPNIKNLTTRAAATREIQPSRWIALPGRQLIPQVNLSISQVAHGSSSQIPHYVWRTHGSSSWIGDYVRHSHGLTSQVEGYVIGGGVPNKAEAKVFIAYDPLPLASPHGRAAWSIGIVVCGGFALRTRYQP